MGHGSNDKLYITQTEHSGAAGGRHSASSGYRAKQQAPHPGALTPFDCCALSFQPFEHPVCARNPDGTGAVFDLVNILPWLKQHNNTNPITGEPCTPNDLIHLNYSRKPDGQIHDPISFKPFSEHSHIVAIATTGNVYLAESIKGGKDLLSDTSFKKEDVITLQNPHAMSSTSSSTAVTAATKTSKVAKSTATKPQAAGVAALREKEKLPWNVSPYSSGLPGASLTSTSVDPTTQTSRLLWDEEELMFEAISNPPKSKSKEADVGKRRAYVRVVTSLGGSLNLELYCEKAPKTCYNFLMLAREGKYDNCIFHRLIPGFMIQTGDPTGTGSGGQSYWGSAFRDEYDLKGAAKHDSRGILAMANRGMGTNTSQFFITFKPTPHLDGKHTVFGKLVGGEDVLDTLERLPRKEGTDRPAKTVRITEIIIYQDPFEEYKTRLKRKLERKAEAEQAGESDKSIAKEKKEGDDVNWFGVKLGIEKRGTGANGSSAADVGKYLNLKRPLETASPSTRADDDDDGKKKRKIGFGNFDSW
ncbi:peptidylprolyl isomerase-like protein 2 [Fomitiporia mediterranea MF3/22]|uniref:peptidylprolyl isomerase-like protein 2 n=1 Tax=Fomitiporia mediterranea (strain MF3/22) TaxID=694068 RepID=UPI000440807E|nr:peptidylprolyl isomerase-like protein 2 [Fomitiporia mediterranea MF3/22]EJD03832.1 peptidylprolyl isomerase-like protein 2 [Fomitiporia mediterranea MF3/22]